MKRHYRLVCSACGQGREDDGLILSCRSSCRPALLRTVYADEELALCSDSDGLFRYRRWLPVGQTYRGAGKTIVFRSERLGRFLGLADLWVAFNGYWPERDAALETCTFKELEAYTVLGRLPSTAPLLVLASAGNTAAAFAQVFSAHQAPCLIIVPAAGLGRLHLRQPLSACVQLVALERADYSDAIACADAVARLPGVEAEGGVRNVGRRDGLATVMYSAVEAIGRLPDYYFQGVGSGAGAIAVHEAALRLGATRAPAGELPCLMLCQNAPFAPIHRAWRSGRAVLVETGRDADRRAVREVHADELTNRRPAYGIRGGVYEVLVESGGDVLVADNASVRSAAQLFDELELIDIEPAAAVALACLRDAVGQGRIPPRAVVLLNVTGGGRRRLASEHSVPHSPPALRLGRERALSAEGVDEIMRFVSESSAGSLRRTRLPVVPDKSPSRTWR